MPSVAVFGAGGFTGALTARLLFSHPRFELRWLTGRADVGRRLDELYPYHRVPLTLESENASGLKFRGVETCRLGELVAALTTVNR